VKFQGYFEPLDKFRKANANFQVRGYELRSFFPQWWLGIQPYSVGVEDSELLKEWFRNGPKINDDIRLAVVSLIERALAITTNDHLALVPGTTKNGNVLAIVDSSFPIILRPRDKGYEYIGECYLHGFMDGEAFAEDENFRVEGLSLL
jgi:hypothetical protein